MANLTSEQVVAALNDAFDDNGDVLVAINMLAHSARITRAGARVALAKAQFAAARQQMDTEITAAEVEKESAEVALAAYVATLK